jgi:hypothetical protein
MKIIERGAPTLGPDGVAELRRLLEGVTLTGQESVLRRGRAVDVLISIWPSGEDTGCFDAHLCAFAPGGKRVRVDGFSLWALGQDEQGAVLRWGEGTSIGDLSIKGLRKGLSYRLDAPGVGAREPGEVLPLRVWEEYAADSFAATHDYAEAELSRYDSADGRVWATLKVERAQEADEVVLSFETSDAALAGSMVRFYLLNRTGRVEYRGEVCLGPARGGCWEGRWSGGLRLARACRLFFRVVPGH